MVIFMVIFMPKSLKRICLICLFIAIDTPQLQSAELITIPHQHGYNTDEAFAEAIGTFSSSETQIITVCESDGKTQLYAIANFLAVLESRLTHPLHQYLSLVVGFSSGAMLASSIAMGIPTSSFLKNFPDDKSRLIRKVREKSCHDQFSQPAGKSNPYAGDGTTIAPSKSMDNKYDAFDKDISLGPTLARTFSSDLLTPLANYTSFQSANPVEKIIYAMIERDTAAKYNFAKLSWCSSLLSSRRKITEKRTGVTEFVQQIRNAVETSSAENTSTLALILNAETTNDSSISVECNLNPLPFIVEILCNIKIPLMMYPKKSMPFEAIKKRIDDSTRRAIFDESTDSSQSMSALISFLEQKIIE
jgi:hypothetical protein